MTSRRYRGDDGVIKMVGLLKSRLFHVAMIAASATALIATARPARAQEQEPPDWPGSFAVADSETRFKIGGFAELDFIYDSDEITTRCEFVTSAITTGDGNTSAANGRTSYCVNATRLTFETRTPTKLGRLTTFVSIDLFGNPSTPELRLRQAYGEIDGALFGGTVLVGQSWSAFTDLDAWPNILDFEGPSSAISTRQPQFRWTKGFGNELETELSAEAPTGAIDGAEPVSGWPDFVAAVKWQHARLHLKGAGVLRDVRASFENGPATSTLGWGLAASGRVVLPALLGSYDAFLFEVSRGRGTGGFYDDAPPDAVYDPDSGELELLPVTAWYVGYDHGWNDVLSSGALYAWLEVDNLAAQAPGAFADSAYFSINLIWTPDTPLMFGVEFLRGGRRDKDGTVGTDNRLQATAKFSF